MDTDNRDAKERTRSTLCGRPSRHPDRGTVAISSPKNQVSWLSNSNGLHFGEYGVILGPGHLVLLVGKAEHPAALRSGCNQITVISGAPYLLSTSRKIVRSRSRCTNL